MSIVARTRLRELHRSGALDVDLPGSENTRRRLRLLCDLARHETVSVARLAEAHTDAVAILDEASRRPVGDAIYGVWASQHPAQRVVYDRLTSQLDGTMPFASGHGIVDRALVVASADDGTVLIDVDVSDLGARSDDASTLVADAGSWASPALADTATGPIAFTSYPVEPGDVVERAGWYLARPGFWRGACAPAACWAGGALGIVDASARLVDSDEHRRAHHGALAASSWAMLGLLDAAGDQIDSDPAWAGSVEYVARSLRFAVATTCRDVLDRFGRAYGPRPYVSDTAVMQRAMDVDLYIKQHHAERELPAIASLGGAM